MTDQATNAPDQRQEVLRSKIEQVTQDLENLNERLKVLPNDDDLIAEKQVLEEKLTALLEERKAMEPRNKLVPIIIVLILAAILVAALLNNNKSPKNDPAVTSVKTEVASEFKGDGEAELSEGALRVDTSPSKTLEGKAYQYKPVSLSSETSEYKYEPIAYTPETSEYKYEPIAYTPETSEYKYNSIK